METKAVKPRSWPKLFVKLLVLAVLTVAVVVPSLTVSNFCNHVEKFNFYLKTDDSVGTNRELAQFHYFYTLSAKWHIQLLADKYLFTDSPFYESADTFLTGNWQEVRNQLKDKTDDPRSYPYGLAKFRQAQAEYQATHKIKPPLNFVMTEVRQDFERDLRNCLRVSEYLDCFDRVWNYDLASNKNDAEEALKQPGKMPGFILGPLKENEEDGPGKPPGDFPYGGRLDEKQSGGGGQKKRP